MQKGQPMLQKFISRLTQVFAKSKRSTKALLSPDWVQEGKNAAAALREIPPHEIGRRAALDNAFQQFYDKHSAACKNAKELSAIPKVAREKFMKGFYSQLGQEQE